MVYCFRFAVNCCAYDFSYNDTPAILADGMLLAAIKFEHKLARNGIIASAANPALKGDYRNSVFSRTNSFVDT